VNEYHLGDRVRIGLSTPFTANGSAFDPEVVNFLIRLPDGTLTKYTYLTDPEVVKNAIGDYEMEIDADLSGIYRYTVEGVTSGGENQGAYDGAFKVLRRRTTI